MYRVRNCETTSPPTTASPSGCRASPPSPYAKAIGSVPASAATVVIMMGRKRIRQPLKIASCGLAPRRRSSIAKSIIMIAFFFTTPNSMIRPTNAYKSSSLWNSVNVSSAPKSAEGRPERIVIG